MGWMMHRAPWRDDGDYSPLQVGKAAHIRFGHSDKSGRLLTASFYPMAPEVENRSQKGSVETFHGYKFDMDRLGVEMQMEYMICEDVNDPGGTEIWCGYRYKSFNVGTYGGNADEKVRAAEADALKFATRFNGERDIEWNGEPF